MICRATSGTQWNPRASSSRRIVVFPEPGPPVMTNRFSTLLINLLCNPSVAIGRGDQFRRHKSRNRIELPVRPAATSNGLHDPFGIPPDADQSGRTHCVKKMQSDKIHARYLLHNAALVNRVAVRGKYRQIDPRKVMPISGAPDDVRYVERAAVGEQR